MNEYENQYQDDGLAQEPLGLIYGHADMTFESLKKRLSPRMQDTVLEILNIIQEGWVGENQRLHLVECKRILADLEVAIGEVAEGFPDREAIIIDCWARAKDLKRLETN